LKRAAAGDATALPPIRELLRAPGIIEAWGGDLARRAERALLDAAAGDNLVFKEAVTRKLELLRAELAGPNPTPLERLLVDRIVACWLQVQDADVRAARALPNATLAGGDYVQRRQDRAHRRYLAAIKTLALVRKLALPVLQLHIDQRTTALEGGPGGRRLPDRLAGRL
jgi:hypothetical protein